MLRISKSLMHPDSNNAVIVAMDHGMIKVRKGFENPGVSLKKVLDGNPDGLLVTPNFARHFCNILATKKNLKLVIRLDLPLSSTLPGEEKEQEIQRLFSDVEEAMQVGADGVAVLLIFGREDPAVFADNITYVGKIAKQAHRLNIPLVVETVLWGKRIPLSEQCNSQLLEHACRMAFELGADVLKVPYPGNREAFARITTNSPIPILILGGPKMATIREVLKSTKAAMQAGGHGVFFGRNIWQHESPSKIINALSKIVHKGSSVEEALELIDV